MKLSKSSLGPTAKKIVARIQKVRKAADKAARSKHRFANYRYLRSVLSAYSFFEDNDLLPHLAEIAPSVLMTPGRGHPLREIIEATCIQPDLRMRSRWTRALEFAVREKINPKELARFFRAHNGIAGCADLEGKTGPKRPRSGTKKSPASTLFRQRLNFSNQLTRQ